jgi:integrase
MIEYKGSTLIGDVDALWLKNFSTWRKSQAKRALDAKAEGKPEGKGARTVGGRTLDLNKLALDHVLDWAVTEKWLKVKPDLQWKKKAKAPKTVRLITDGELARFCAANLVTLEGLTVLPKRIRQLRAAQAESAEAFEDFLRLMALTGGREHETIVQDWNNVNWERRVIHFPGENAKAGGGEPAAPREIPFYDKLESHLKSMWERRNKDSDWIFPSSRNPKFHTKSFRKQLEHARTATGIDDVGFHHMKHFFISGCVMRGVDFKTIAYWASHRDGGVLIGRVYDHGLSMNSGWSTQK